MASGKPGSSGLAPEMRTLKMKSSNPTDSATLNPWLPAPRPDSTASLRLFCFPYAGGGAMIYRTWADSLPKSVEVIPIQLPGRETRLRETPFTSLQSLVETLGPVLLPYLDRPFAFFGHSMGGLISFELARWLRRHHELQPVHLFVSGRWAPQIVGPDPPSYNLPEAEFLEEVRSLDGTPEEVFQHPELLQLLLPLLRADFTVCQTYTHLEEEPLRCPITVYGGLQDRSVGRAKLEGWRQHTAASFVLRMFPGGHFFLHGSQQQLLHTLAHDLAQVVRALELTRHASTTTSSSR